MALGKIGASFNGAQMQIENDALTRTIIGCAITVHRALGVGLLESAYQYFLSHELAKAGLEVRQQAALPVTYDGATFDLGFRPDLIVNSKVIVEVKAIAAFLPIHRAQLLTYLRFAELERGLLINFHCEPLIKGIKRVERPARSRSSSAGEQQKVLSKENGGKLRRQAFLFLRFIGEYRGRDDCGKATVYAVLTDAPDQVRSNSVSTVSPRGSALLPRLYA